MGALDIFRTIGSIPRRINEARFNHANVNVPAEIPLADPNEIDPDEMVTVGYDPDTGEPIQIAQSSLGGVNVDMKTGQPMQQKSVRTGPSKFGRFLSEGLPRMVESGIAAATTPSNGMDHGVLGVLRGMDIGRDRLQKRDMLAYQTARQRQQDELANQERMSRAAENEAQAAWYRHRAEEEAKPRPATPPSTWEAALVRQHAEAMQAGDLERANEIAAMLNQKSKMGEGGRYQVVGGDLFDRQEGTWVNRPAKPEASKDPKPTFAQAKAEKTKIAVGGYMMRAGQDIEKAIEIARKDDADPDTQMALADMRRKMASPAAKGRNPITRTPTPSQALAIAAEREASDILKQAGQDVDKAIALAKAKNSSLRVQNLLVDAKKKAAPPRAAGRTNAVPTIGGGPAWKRTQAVGGR